MILPMANGTAIVTPLEIHKSPTATEIRKKMDPIYRKIHNCLD